MAKSRLIGSYPVIGIRPTIDGRRGPLKVRESLEVQTMNMAKSAAELISKNVFYSNGEPVKVVIADTTIGRVAEAAACADKFRKEGVDITISGGTVTVSPKESQAGTRVEIKVTPKSGYEMKTLTVTDANGKNVSVNTDNNGKYSFVMPESDVTIKVTFGVKSTSAADKSNPKTGDDFGLAAWNATAIISLAVLAILILNKKKCRWM